MLPVGHWRCTYLPDGYEAKPIDAPDAGVLRIRERFRPLATIDWHIDEELRLYADRLVEPARGAVEYLTTVEGEYAAIGSYTGKTRRDGSPFLGVVALVFGDDWYRRIDAHVVDSREFDRFRTAVRELTFRSTLGLGEIRRRRFVYTPPQSWSGLSRGLLTQWFPLGYPVVDAIITVPAVWPGKDIAPPFLDRLTIDGNLGAFFRERQTGPDFVTSDHGLSGRMACTYGQFAGQPKRVIQQAHLRDERFTYYVRLDCSEDLHKDLERTFLAVVQSCKALPQASGSDIQFEALLHWAE